MPIEAFNDDYEEWKDVPVGAGNYKVKAHDQKSQTMLLEMVGDLASAKEIMLYYSSKPHSTDIEMSAPVGDREIALSKRAAGLTSIYFNFNNSVASDIRFRRAINEDTSRSTFVYALAVQYHHYDDFCI